MSTNRSNSIVPNQKAEIQMDQASGTSKKFKKRNSKSHIGMQDFMSIKNTDDIENFYEIDTIIGRGTSTFFFTFKLDVITEMEKHAYVSEKYQSLPKVINKRHLQ